MKTFFLCAITKMDPVKITVDDICVLEKILPSFDTNNRKIEKNIKQINRWMRYDYKYGSSWLDKWWLMRSVKRLNNLLKPYCIIVV